MDSFFKNYKFFLILNLFQHIFIPFRWQNICAYGCKDEGSLSDYNFWREHMGDTPAVGDSHFILSN